MAEDGEVAPPTAWTVVTMESLGRWKAEWSEAGYLTKKRSGAFAHNLSVSSCPHYAWEGIGYKEWLEYLLIATY